MKKKYSVTGTVLKWPSDTGWYYVPIKETYETLGRKPRTYGFLKIKATLGETSWETSLMPAGKNKDGVSKLFIAIKASVRKAEGIQDGDRVTITYTLL